MLLLNRQGPAQGCGVRSVFGVHCVDARLIILCRQGIQDGRLLSEERKPREVDFRNHLVLFDVREVVIRLSAFLRHVQRVLSQLLVLHQGDRRVIALEVFIQLRYDPSDEVFAVQVPWDFNLGEM